MSDGLIETLLAFGLLLATGVGSCLRGYDMGKDAERYNVCKAANGTIVEGKCVRRDSLKPVAP